MKRVGKRIAAVANRKDYQWDFRLIESETQNAFCLPGGKVAIYQGILPVCEDEAGLAVVMSHEIAHALARHGGERMSQNMASDGAKVLIDKVAGKYVPEKKELLMQAYGVGSKYAVLLPYSRKHESEADQIGLRLMAKAGYDPTVAPEFWTRFGSMKEGDSMPEFLSTHPSDAPGGGSTGIDGRGENRIPIGDPKIRPRRTGCVGSHAEQAQATVNRVK